MLLRGLPMMARDAAGNVYAAVPRARDHEILKFASDGSLAGTFGRYGTGPGEYHYVVSLTLFHDSVLVVAHDDRYITELTTIHSDEFGVLTGRLYRITFERPE